MVSVVGFFEGHVAFHACGMDAAVVALECVTKPAATASAVGPHVQLVADRTTQIVV
jgi:hypothetical protein